MVVIRRHFSVDYDNNLMMDHRLVNGRKSGRCVKLFLEWKDYGLGRAGGAEVDLIYLELRIYGIRRTINPASTCGVAYGSVGELDQGTKNRERVVRL